MICPKFASRRGHTGCSVLLGTYARKLQLQVHFGYNSKLLLNRSKQRFRLSRVGHESLSTKSLLNPGLVQILLLELEASSITGRTNMIDFINLRLNADVLITILSFCSLSTVIAASQVGLIDNMM